MGVDMTEMYDDLAARPGDEMDFLVTRDEAKREPGRTLSAEAMGDFNAAIETFIASRIAYHWDQKPGGRAAVGPSVIRAEVRITVDDVHNVPTDDERPWYAVDGQGRNGS